jgi:hypothetical protein
MTAIAAGAPSRTWTTSFYTWMTVACAATAFAGYIPTYWAPLAGGAFQANPVVHLHAMAFFAWTLFAMVQTSLVSSRRVALHRALGMVGISLATILTMLGLLAALNAINREIPAALRQANEAFLIVPLQAIATFAVIFVLGIATIRRPETHKRLMLLATIALLNAPLARPLIVFVFHFPLGPPPVWLNVPAYLASFLLLIPPMIYDWRTRGQPHPVYLVALPVLTFLAWAVIPISGTHAWHTFAQAFATLGGHPPAHIG